MPRPLMANSTFNGLYIRPNASADGAIPASTPFCSSPDIWLAGTSPVKDFPTALATTQSYALASNSNILSGQNNCIYVRAKNGAAAAQSRNVTLYYAPSGVIQQPSKWQNNIIQTDRGQKSGILPSTVTGQVGVCSDTFLWADPQSPPPGSDHYCLFAQLNDAQNSNPFPNVETVFDMGALIMNNLGWGWRNVSLIPSDASWQVSEPLAIPDNYPAQTYAIQVQPTGWIGWDVEFYCSQRDANGNEIKLKRTKINQDGQILGIGSCMLDGGFLGQMTINLYSPDGRPAPAGATIPLSCNFIASKRTELLEAMERGLVDWNLVNLLHRDCPELAVGPTALIIQGSYSATVSNHPGVLAWWKDRGFSPRKGGIKK